MAGFAVTRGFGPGATATSLIARGLLPVSPIFNTMRASYKDEPTPRIEVTPTRLAVKQPDIKINITNIRSKHVDN